MAHPTSVPRQHLSREPIPPYTPRQVKAPSRALNLSGLGLVRKRNGYLDGEPRRVVAWTNVSYLGRFLRLAQFCLPVAAAFAVSGPILAQSTTPQFVYAAGEGSSNISAFQLNATTGALTAVPGSPFNGRSNPHALAVDPAGKFLFVADQTANNISVFAINQTSGALTEVPSSPFASGSGSSPNVLTVDATGKFLFVANATATAN